MANTWLHIKEEDCGEEGRVNQTERRKQEHTYNACITTFRLSVGLRGNRAQSRKGYRLLGVEEPFLREGNQESGEVDWRDEPHAAFVTQETKHSVRQETITKEISSLNN